MVCQLLSKFIIMNYFGTYEILQATVLVELQLVVGQLTNSVARYIGWALIGLHKTTFRDLTNRNIQSFI